MKIPTILKQLLPTVLATLAFVTADARAQLPDDSHWFYEYGGPGGEAFGVEMAGEYAYVYGGFLDVDGNPDMKNLTRFHLKRERFEQVPGIDSLFTNFIRNAFYDSVGNNLFISGDFSSVDGVTARRIARFDLDTETWHALEDSTLGDDDRYGPSSGNGYAVVRVGNYVYLGGFLMAHADDGQKFVRRYNLSTSRWEAVGTGLNNTVRCFAVDSNGNLFAGGGFTATGDGGTPASFVARWTGSAWVAVDGGITGTFVRAMDFDSKDRLAVGGQFTAAGAGGSVACNNVAGWKQGAGWNNLDGGITPEAGESVFGIWGLSFASDDKLYVGGDFSFDATGTVDLNKVAYYDNDQWNAMGSGLGRSSSQIVNGVGTHGCEPFFVGLYARGWTAPNSKPNFARWNPEQDNDGYVPGTPWINCSPTIEPHPTNANQLRMSHTSFAGQSYVVQASDDLRESWVDFSAPFAAINENGVVWTITPTNLRKFYRIVVSE